MDLTTATLKLFNAVQTENTEHDFSNVELYGRMVQNGYILDSRIIPTLGLIRKIDEVVGIGGKKLNSSFHKSWEKVAQASDLRLLAEQILHYFTTYGFESVFGTYDSRFVYIPHEKLELPTEEDVPLLYIRAMTAEEILNEIVGLGSSGIALHQATLDSIMEIVKHNEYSNEFVSDITNRELYTLLCDFYGIVPSDPVQYLRYVISKLTGESLVIKNEKLINLIKASDGEVLDSLIEQAPENLASIFFRYKPLFLAMKSISRNKTFFNRLRKDANTLHIPLQPDYLNTITHQIKSGTLKKRQFNTALKIYPVWRKIRLAYALHNRMNVWNSIVYRIRNGSAWASDFKKDMEKTHAYEEALYKTLDSISSDIRPNVSGKLFYIPGGIHYALPATEKQFVGNLPANTYVSVDDNLVVGVHWYNGEHNRVDIDLSLLDENGMKFGWDASYRNSERSVLFSGDVTDAPLPDGASEFFYLREGIEVPLLIFANYFNYDEDCPVDSQLVVASENVSRGFTEQQGYMINPNNILVSEGITISKKQNVMGLITSAYGKNRVHFTNFSIGKSITSSHNVNTERTFKFYLDTSLNPILLSDVIEMAGGEIIRELPEDGEIGDFVDLSPFALDKNTILSLFVTE